MGAVGELGEPFGRLHVLGRPMRWLACLSLPLAISGLAIASVCAEPIEQIEGLDSLSSATLYHALERLGIDPPALGFDKLYAVDDSFRLSIVEELLNDPLKIPGWQSSTVDRARYALTDPAALVEFLGELCEVLGDDREIALCRELTKRFEEVLRGTCGQVRDMVADRMASGRALKGEMVLVINRAGIPVATDEDVEAALRVAMDTMPLKAASTQVADQLKMSKRDVYQMGLRLKNALAFYITIEALEVWMMF